MAVAPAAAAASPSLTTLISDQKRCASSTSSAPSSRVSSSAKSVARIAVPSIAAAFVTISSSPGLAPDEVT